MRADTSSNANDFGLSSEEMAQLAAQMGGAPPPQPMMQQPSPMQSVMPQRPVSKDSKCPKCQKLGHLCKICEKLEVTKVEVKQAAGFDATAPLPHIEIGPNFKVIPLDAAQVRALIGKNGETIRMIRQKCPVTEVLIGHEKHESHGILRLTGDIESAEAVVKDLLLRKGCLTPTVPHNVAYNANTFKPFLTEFPVAEVMPSNSRRDTGR